MESDIKYWMPTGITSLDFGILGGGVPSGRIIEIYGSESTAKTTLTLELAKAFCKFHANSKLPYKVLWLETESSLDRPRAKYMKVPLEKFQFIESQELESIFTIVLNELKAAQKDKTQLLICIDTLAAAKPQTELAGNKWGGGMMLAPRLINDSLAKVTKILGDSVLLLPNQCYESTNGRQKILVSKGGKGIKYYSSIRIELSKSFNYKQMQPDGSEVAVGIGVEAKTVKNKVFMAGQEVTFVLKGEKGIDELESLIFFLMAKDLIILKGSWKKIEYMGKEYSFQSIRKLREKIATEDDWKGIYELMKFRVLQYYCGFSDLLKIRSLKKLWAGEKKFFGKKITVLDNDEQKVLDYMKNEMSL